jgi:hypothetical protein
LAKQRGDSPVLPGIEPLLTQEMVDPIRSLAVTRRQLNTLTRVIDMFSQIFPVLGEVQYEKMFPNSEEHQRVQSFFLPECKFF